MGDYLQQILIITFFLFFFGWLYSVLYGQFGSGREGLTLKKIWRALPLRKLVVILAGLYAGGFAFLRFTQKFADPRSSQAIVVSAFVAVVVYMIISMIASIFVQQLTKGMRTDRSQFVRLVLFVLISALYMTTYSQMSVGKKLGIEKNPTIVATPATPGGGAALPDPSKAPLSFQGKLVYFDVVGAPNEVPNYITLKQGGHYVSLMNQLSVEIMVSVAVKQPDGKYCQLRKQQPTQPPDEGPTQIQIAPAQSDFFSRSACPSLPLDAPLYFVIETKGQILFRTRRI